MSSLVLAPLLLAMAAAPAAKAAPVDHRLFGVWRIVSTSTQTEGVEGQSASANEGYIVFTPAQRVFAISLQPGRKPAANDAEALALARSMVVYSGKFDLTPDHYTVHLEFTSTQLNLDQPQVRYYKIDGDKLTIRTPMHDSNLVRGQRNQTVLNAVRDE